MRRLLLCLEVLAVCTGLSSLSNANADINHELELLGQTAGASLLICGMMTRTEFLRAQMQTSDMGKVETLRWQCAKDQERKVVPYLHNGEGSPARQGECNDVTQGVVFRVVSPDREYSF